MSKNYFKRAVVMFISFVMLITIFPDVSITVNAAYENTHINTGNQRADIVAIAQTHVGYHEGSLEGTTNGSDNYTKYNVDLYKIEGSYKYMWCQSFIAWCAKQAGVSSSVIKRTAGTVDAMDFFKAQGVWQGRNYTPQSGDIIYFTSSSSNSGYHVGIVESVSGSTINTIEGNYSNKVARHSVTVGSSSIVGYGVPNYIVPDPKPPTYSNLTADKTIIAIGEEITFTASSDYATGFTIGIYEGTEQHLVQAMPNGKLTLTFDKTGEYGAFVSAYNSMGYVDSNWVGFTVYDSVPTYSNLEADKTMIAVGEEITFTASSDHATGFTIGIDNEIERYLTQGMENGMLVLTFDKAGKYGAYVTSYNSVGYADSKWIGFTVYDSSPTYSKLTADKTAVAVGEKIKFTVSSDYASEYWIGIDNKDGRYLTKNMPDGCLSVTFDKPGEYSAYVTSSNKFGGKDSTLIKFVVFSSIEGDINNDDKLTVADAVLLQKWLLAEPDVELANWKAADLCEDGRLDVFDLCLMKRMLVENS